jgi:hypothetical protein
VQEKGEIEAVGAVQERGDWVLAKGMEINRLTGSVQGGNTEKRLIDRMRGRSQESRRVCRYFLSVEKGGMVPPILHGQVCTPSGPQTNHMPHYLCMYVLNEYVLLH